MITAKHSSFGITAIERTTTRAGGVIKPPGQRTSGDEVRSSPAQRVSKRTV